MTREERIEQIEKFASQCYEDGERYSAFIAGSIWADNNPPQDIVNLNNVWHDASEEPQSGIEMLIEYENQWGTYKYRGTFYLHKDSEVRWKELCEEQKVIRWAYISDLLPKKFGDSEKVKGE